MRVSHPIAFDGSVPVVRPVAYDATKITAGSLIDQWNFGAVDGDKFLGPMPVRLGRPFETAAQSAGFAYPHVISVSDTLDWIFMVTTATPAATRQVVLYEMNRATAVLTYIGFVTVTMPVAGSQTVRGFRTIRTLHTTGTVAVSGTAVTGTGTLFLGQRVAAGSRIKFGTTDPMAAGTWYTIVPTAAIASETALTLVETAPTFTAGTPYVISDLRLVMSMTNATTATNGGLFVSKGLHAGLFTGAGTTIPAATTIDNIRACYWLKDAAVVANINAAGCSLDDAASFTQHDAYVLDGAATSSRVFRYNLRAALTLTAGAATTAFTLSTGIATLIGNQSQQNNGRIDTLLHGPGGSIKCLYWVTGTRVYRASVGNIGAASTTWALDAMLETPDGGVNTTAATGALTAVEVAGSLDRLVLTSGGRSYVTQYRTDGGSFDHNFMVDGRQIDQTTADPGITPYPGLSSTASFSLWIQNGLCYLTRVGNTAVQNQLYVFPVGADWTYTATTGQRAVLPKITLSALKFYRVATNHMQTLGDNQLGKSPEPYRVVYRTSGIDDNTGAWTVVPPSGDLSGVGVAAAIQFALEFKTIGDFCIPARVLNLELIYEDDAALPSQYMWSDADSEENGTFGFTQFSLLPSLGTHTITIRNANTGATALTQASTGTTNGSFQFWNGSAWVAGLGTNTVSARRRFVPTGTLPAGALLYAQITVA